MRVVVSVLIMIVGALMIEVLMLQRLCSTEWSSDGGNDDRGGGNHSDHSVMVYQR